MNLTQGTPEWLEWRRQGLGSSDAPIIMGVSPYKTPLELYRIKIGEVKEDATNWATERGHDWEPKARAACELQLADRYGEIVDMAPAIFEHESCPWLRVSLDGWNEGRKAILEIKVPGKDDHATALAGRVPEKYIPQVQMQLMVTGAHMLHYWSYVPNVGGVMVDVLPDTAYHGKLLEKLIEFWRMVQDRRPPPMTDQDVLDMNDDEEFRALCVCLRDTKEDLDSATAAYEELREKLAAQMRHTRCKAAGVLLTKVYTKGRIDYSKAVPEGVDLEQFRGEGSWSVRPTFPKEGK